MLRCVRTSLFSVPFFFLLSFNLFFFCLYHILERSEYLFRYVCVIVSSKKSKAKEKKKTFQNIKCVQNGWYTCNADELNSSIFFGCFLCELLLLVSILLAYNVFKEKKEKKIIFSLFPSGFLILNFFICEYVYK